MRFYARRLQDFGEALVVVAFLVFLILVILWPE